MSNMKFLLEIDLSKVLDYLSTTFEMVETIDFVAYNCDDGSPRS